MTISQTKCDECGRIKGEDNRWFSIYDSLVDNFTVMTESPAPRNAKDICGEQCLHVALGKWVQGLDTKSFLLAGELEQAGFTEAAKEVQS